MCVYSEKGHVFYDTDMEKQKPTQMKEKAEQ